MNKDEKKSIKKELKRSKLEIINVKWILEITAVAFFVSLLFSYASESFIPKASLLVSIIILIIVILLGVIFDMIGVSVQAANEAPFHSMNSRKVKGADIAVKFKKSSDKTSTFCNDVIGDICGIISGTAGSIIAVKLATKYNLNEFNVILIVTAIVSSLTIGGKALGKTLAINKSNYILYGASKFISNFKK